MGKIRVKTLGAEELEEKQKKDAKVKREQKILSQKAKESAVEEPVEPKKEEVKTEEKKEVKTKTKKEKFKKTQSRKRSQRYNSAKVMVEKKPYKLSEALEVLAKLPKGKFDETVEIHINTLETGISGNLTLPHGTGKKTRVAIATDALIEQIEKGLPATPSQTSGLRGGRGLIDFDILVATPDMMPKLAKVAKILGPKGLMPNPKNGTITQNPESVIKKFEGGQINFKTEAKSPIIHLTVGKLSFGDKKLSENIKTALSAIPAGKIKKVILKSTMSPAIKIEL
ncbi:MAG: 50S ribosomal protein L1 [Patescibacteria group bacterium]